MSPGSAASELCDLDKLLNLSEADAGTTMLLTLRKPLAWSPPPRPLPPSFFPPPCQPTGRNTVLVVLLTSLQPQSTGFCDNLEGGVVGGGAEMGGRFGREGTCACLWLTHADEWPRPTQCWKATTSNEKKYTLKRDSRDQPAPPCMLRGHFPPSTGRAASGILTTVPF